MAIASIFSDFSVFVLLFSTISAVPPPIQQACKATRYPQTCQASLLQSTLNIPSNPTPTHIIQAVLSVSSQKTTSTQSMVHDILLSSSHNHNRSMAATTCLELLHMSAIRTFTSSSSLARGNIKDARAFAGAALAYQYDCWSELYYVNGTHQVNQTMSFLDTSLMPSTSNALSMMMALDNAGPDTRSWDPPKTERDGFWERVGSRSGSDHDLGFPIRFPAVKKADATVCKGSKAKGCYGTVQEAVEAAPVKLGRGRRWVIHVREGVYEERVRVPLEKTNLVLVGDGMGKTVITGSVNTGILGISTYNTATVGVLGDGFMASGITFENKAGPNAHQAVAFRSDSDFSLVENCEFLGNQDTLYAHSLRQIYRKCLIQGNVDFIFGNAAAIFQNCTILVRPRLMNPTDGENNAITASGRTDPAEPTGFVFLGCLINGTNEYMRLYHSNPIVHKNYLGRPWKTYARTVFINCVIEELISPEGWMPFRGDLGLSTLYYGEFGNKGPGANLKGRVRWSSWIPAQHLNVYSTGNFLQADEWISASPSNVGLMRDWN